MKGNTRKYGFQSQPDHERALLATHSAGANFATAFTHNRSWAKGILRCMYEEVAFVGLKKIVDAKDGRIGMHNSQSRIVRIHSIVYMRKKEEDEP